MGVCPHPAWFICSIRHYRPYYTIATAWVTNQRYCIGLVQILFEPAETICCYQWYMIIILGFVFSSASGISFCPISFTLYTTPLDTIARTYQLNFHLYADDIQLNMASKPNNVWSLPLTISNIQNCVIDIQSWMTANMFTTKHGQNGGFSSDEQKPQKSHYHKQNQIDSIDISTAHSIRNLGAIFESALSP